MTEKGLGCRDVKGQDGGLNSEEGRDFFKPVKVRNLEPQQNGEVFVHEFCCSDFRDGFQTALQVMPSASGRLHDSDECGYGPCSRIGIVADDGVAADMSVQFEPEDPFRALAFGQAGPQGDRCAWEPAFVLENSQDLQVHGVQRRYVHRAAAPVTVLACGRRTELVAER